MAELFQTLQEFAQAVGLPFTQVPDNTVIQIPTYVGVNGRWTVFAQAVEERQEIVFYSVCPVTTPAAKRATMAEFLTRANYGLLIGNFEMDYGDGEVRFKTSMVAPVELIGASELGKAVMAQLLQLNVVAMDRYLPGIMAIASTDASPADLIDQIEVAESLSPTDEADAPPEPESSSIDN